MKYYKVLDRDGRSCHGGVAEWSLPTKNDDGTWTPGDWMPPVEGYLKPCANGYHVVSIGQLLEWLGERIFEVEVGDEIVHDDDKSVVRTCRLTRECTGWNDLTARLFACDCAARVLHLYEAEYPDDDRPRKAIEVSRKYANGEATREELNTARDSALDAALAATLNAARVTEWDTALNAASNAAWSAAEYSALDIAWAARDAAWDYAWDDERQWQEQRLREILEGAE